MRNGDRDLEDCIGVALSRAMFPISRLGVTVDYRFDPEPAR